MARTVKVLLSSSENEIFRNWNDMPGSQVKAVSIWLSNNSASAVDVYLSFVVLSGLFINGAILSGVSLAANETLQIPIEPRIIAMDESIRGYASVSNVVALSLDLIGDIGPDSPPLV